jgi:hypothetical protein
MRVAATVIVTCLLLTPSAARAQSSSRPFSAALVYDALADGPICPISERGAKFLSDAERRHEPLPPDIQISCGRAAFEDTTGLTLFVLRPRFGADYGSITCKSIDLGTGVLEPRGLQDVTPLALGTLGTPVPHGGAQPSVITVTPLTPAMVLAQLIDPVRMNQPRLTLEAQWTDILRARHTLDVEAGDLRTAIGRVRTGGPEAPPVPAACGAISGAPAVQRLNTCVEAIAARVAANDRNPPIVLPPGAAPPCEPATGAKDDGGMPVAFPWNTREFLCVVSQIDARIEDLTMIRNQLAAYGVAGAVDRVLTESDQLIAKVHTFEANLTVIERTIADFRGQKSTMSALQRVEIKKQLKDRYGAQLDDAELNELVTHLVIASSGHAFRDRFERTISALELAAAAYHTQVGIQLAQVQHQADDAQAARNGLSRDIDTLNGSFAGLFTAINNVYRTRADAVPVAYPLTLIDLPGSNKDVFCELAVTEKFKPYRFTAVTAPPAPAGAAGPIVTTPSNVSASAAQANLPSSLPRRFTFEVHKLWHANIVGGFVFSSLPHTEFGVHTQDGAIVATRTDNQRPVAHYLLGFNYYLKPRDTFWRTSTRPSYWIPGVMFGIGIENSKQFFVGPNFEPTLGVDFSFGWHYGEQDALPLNVTADKTALPAGTTTASTRSVMKSGVYGMFGLDVNTFRRFLGLLSPVGGR